MKGFWLLISLLVVNSWVAVFASALNDAAAKGDVAAITAALDSGADVNQLAERTTPLCEATANNHLEAVQILIQRGADVNRAGKFRRTPLDMAAMRNSAGIVKLLLQNGAKPDATASGSTPLQVAADIGCFECVKSLVEAGADINLLTSTGSPAIHLAKRNGHENIVTYLRSHGAKKPTLPSVAASLKAAAPKAGQEMFRQKCGSCHRSITEPSKGSAPPLWGVIGRNKGSLEGFEYSAALKEDEGTWTYDALNAFIFNPAQTVPGTEMIFPGMPEETRRADIIAYLRTLSDAPLPLPYF
jgi:cytochrome c